MLRGAFVDRIIVMIVYLGTHIGTPMRRHGPRSRRWRLNAARGVRLFTSISVHQRILARGLEL